MGKYSQGNATCNNDNAGFRSHVLKWELWNSLGFEMKDLKG